MRLVLFLATIFLFSIHSLQCLALKRVSITKCSTNLNRRGFRSMLLNRFQPLEFSRGISYDAKYRNIALFASRSPRTSGGSGGTALDTRVEQKVSTKIRDEIEKNWRLILHDDTIHTIQQVCDIVSSACPLCPGPRAYEVTMEVHMTGAGTICVANKKLVSEYTRILQSAGLTVSMAPDDDFESSQT